MTKDASRHEWFCHEAAIVETSNVGKGTRVWAFAHILPGARLGEDCNVCDGVFIENEVAVGDRVTLKCGVQLWDGVTLEDDVFVGPNATFTNDPFPRSRQRPTRVTPTLVRHGASIGANATILCGVTIGEWAMVGAGAVVTHDVPPRAIVFGNPACVHGYVDTPTGSSDSATANGDRAREVGVGAAVMHQLSKISDPRGSLVVGEVGREVPFVPRRFFVVYDVPTKYVRGEHAHKTLEQFLVVLRGECSVVLDDGRSRIEVRLRSASTGLYLPPMVWGIQYKFSQDAALLVLASAPYDANDYIRDYREFVSLVANPK